MFEQEVAAMQLLAAMMKTTTLILASFFNVFAFGQDVTRIKLVNGLTKKPIKGQYVEILSYNDTHERVGTTDSFGIYTLDFLPVGGIPYQADVDVEGYKPVRKDIDLFGKGIV